MTGQILKAAEARAARGVLALSPPLQIALAVLSAVAAAAVLGFAWWFLTAPQRAAQAAAMAKVATVTGAAQTAASGQAAQIVDRGAQRDQQTLTIRMENAGAIRTLPSAAQVAATDADADAWRRGLCLYGAAGGDRECDRLLKANPRKLPGPGP